MELPRLQRTYLLDFYRLTDVAERKKAMEGLTATLKTNPKPIPALRAKTILPAKAKLGARRESITVAGKGVKSELKRWLTCR